MFIAIAQIYQYQSIFLPSDRGFRRTTLFIFLLICPLILFGSGHKITLAQDFEIDPFGPYKISSSSDYMAVATGSNLGQVSRVILTQSFPYLKSIISGETDQSMIVSAIDYAKPYVYAITNYSKISIIDVSDPNYPQLKGVFQDAGFSTSLQDLKIADNYLFVTDLLKGLWIIDISDPLRPKRIGLLSGSLVYGIYVGAEETGQRRGRKVYLTTWKYGLKIYDWLGRDQFVLRSQSALLSPFNLDVHLHSPTNQEYIYIANGDSLKIITEEGQVVNSLDADFWLDPNTEAYIPHISDVKVRGAYAYIVDSRSCLYVVDVKVPECPILTGRLALPSGAKSITIRGDIALIAEGPNGLDLVDISVASHPVFRQHVFTHGNASLVRVENEAQDYAFIANGYAGFALLDIRSLAVPAAIGHLPVNGDIWDLTVAAGRAYLSMGMLGLKIIDVKDPWKPRLDSCVEKADIGKKTILVSDCCPYQNGFYMVDESNMYAFSDIQSQPSLLKSMADPIKSIIIQGDYLYMVTHTQGLHIFQINPDFLPQGELALGSMPQNLVVKDNTAYIANGTQGVLVIDLSNPGKPQKVFQKPLPYLVLDVGVKGDYAYLVNGSYGLSVVNMVDVARPVQRIKFENEYLESCFVQGDFLYAAGNFYGVWVMDISDPSTPVILANVPTPRGANVVFADQEQIYDGNRFGMLDIYPVPRSLPFRQTDSFIRFKVPAGLPLGFYDLIFLDTQGEKIRRPHALQIEEQIPLHLRAGLNLFGYPGKAPVEYSDSYRLIDSLGSAVQSLRPENRISQLPQSNIFPLEDRRAYLLYLWEDKDIILPTDYFYPLEAVLAKISSELKEAGSLISLPIKDEVSSFDFCQKLKKFSHEKRLRCLQKFDNFSGKWESTYGFYNQGCGQNFLTRPGDGYLLY